MVGTQDSRRFFRRFTGDWLRLLIIVLFFVLVGLVSTSPAADTSPPAASVQQQDASGPCKGATWGVSAATIVAPAASD